jgi:hypothetical protein
MSSVIVLLGSDEPIPGDDGSEWKAVDGEPAFRRVLFVDDPAAVDRSRWADNVSVWVGEQIDSIEEKGELGAATAMMAVGQEPEPGFEQPFNAWMDDEHVPGLGAVPGTIAAHRYRAIDAGDGPEYFAVYHLADLTVNTRPEWKAVSASPLGAEMKPHSRKRIRGLYQAG